MSRWPIQAGCIAALGCALAATCLAQENERADGFRPGQAANFRDYPSDSASRLFPDRQPAWTADGPHAARPTPSAAPPTTGRAQEFAPPVQPVAPPHTPTNAPQSAPVAAPPSSDGISLNTPRATLRTLFRAIETSRLTLATGCLDFGGLAQPVAETNQQELAARLRSVIRRMEVVFDRVPDVAHHPQAFRLSDAVDPTAPDARADAAKIVLVRGRDGLWRFSAATIAAIDDLWQKWGADAEAHAANAADPLADSYAARHLRRLFPPSLRQTHFFLPDYQWICLAVVFVAGLMAVRGVRVVLFFLGKTPLGRWQLHGAQETRERLWRSVSWLAGAAAWHVGIQPLGLPDELTQLLSQSIKIFAGAIGMLASFRLIDLLAAYFAARARETSSKIDDLLVPLVTKSLKTVAACVVGLSVANAIGYEVTGLVASLGLSGAALALASKDALSNVFGSLNLLADRPFEIGDWVVVDGVEGEVEEVGFRSTRIRTFYNSLVTVPNMRLTTAIVDNLGRRRYRRVKSTLTLTFDTPPARIEAFCEGIRELIRRHPYTRKDFFLVYLNQVTDKSLEVLVDCFLDCPDLTTELRERHRLLLDIVALGDELQISFTARPRQQKPDDTMLAELQADPQLYGRQQAAQLAGPPATSLAATPTRRAA